MSLTIRLGGHLNKGQLNKAEPEVNHGLKWQWPGFTVSFRQLVLWRDDADYLLPPLG
jgi:hypothetical protein